MTKKFLPFAVVLILTACGSETPQPVPTSYATLTITKSDIIDETMMEQLQEHLPHDVETIFISAVTGYNIPKLKDLLYKKLTANVES